MSTKTQVSSYKDLVRQTDTPTPTVNGAEAELDSLIKTLKKRKEKREAQKAADEVKQNPVVRLREQIKKELIAEVKNLATKYSKTGIKIRFDP